MKQLFFIILFIITRFGFSQTSSKEQSDCSGAIVFQDSISGFLTIPEGFGNKLEIHGHDIENPYFFTEEHNTLWIKLIITKDARFEFIIRPDLPDEDYDFSIFKILEGNYCDSIATNKVLPVRSNICRKKPEEKSITGLREGFENHYAPAGESPSFSAPLDVKKGEEYYLVLDGPYGAIGGFKFETKSEEEVILKALEKTGSTSTTMHIMTVNEAGEKVLNPKIQVKGTGREDSIYKDSIGGWIIDKVRNNTRYTITITGKGYKQQTFHYFHTAENDSTLVFTLEKLLIGAKLKFEHINFVGNQATILPTSRNDLRNLTLFLKENPDISVEIGGHVNGKGKNRRKYKKLSKKRAKAIYNYLIEKNINPKQLTYKGYGNSKIIYPEAIIEQESKANRRVEAIVTKTE